MITLNNSNIVFDINNQILESKYSISLSQNTSNFIFKTNDVERMTIMNNGNIGIGKTTTNYKLDINGIINASTFYINSIEIPTYVRNTSDYVGTTSNILIGSIGNTSNYIGLTSNILLGRINDTSNFIGFTSNILLGCINDTRNFVGFTSNILIGRISNTSNLIQHTCNIFINNISYTSNYVGTTSNILVGCIRDTNNYVGTTSNILVGHISNTSNYISITSNLFTSNISYTSNYIKNVSNLLIGRINDTSNYVGTTSNILIGLISYTSNYVKKTSNILINGISDTRIYVGTTSNILDGRISNTSNLIQHTCNLFINNISYTSNYVGTTSNILVGNISNASNYVKINSNILDGGISYTSNYVGITSNILVGLISDTSNYIQRTNNKLVETINNIPKIWITDNNNIYFNTSNVGIGTYNPTSKLHLYDNINLNTEAIIQNNFQSNVQNNVELISSTTSLMPTISGNITGSTTDKFMIFKDTGVEYKLAVSSKDISCDILMIGGGGSSGVGGGGAGACIVAINKIFPANTKFIVTVGSGGIPYNEVIYYRGGNSTIKNEITNNIMYSAIGGGGGRYQGGDVSLYTTYVSGGCGCGGSGSADYNFPPGIALSNNVVDEIQNIGPSITSTYAVYGNNGGADAPTIIDASSGGGGIGNIGNSETYDRTVTKNRGLVGYEYNADIGKGGSGGSGLYKSIINGITYNFKEYFANNTDFGVGVLENNITNYYIGGGGAGVGESLQKPVGGYGGGGDGRYVGPIVTQSGSVTQYTTGIGSAYKSEFRNIVSSTPGIINTGSGGGGGYSADSKNGGSGIVIIRYRESAFSKSSIELVNGTTSDSNVDYSIGNYDGIFKIISSSSNQLIPAERLVIKANGNVGIGYFTYPQYPLHVSSIAISSEDIIYIQNGNNPWTNQIRSVGAQVIPASAKFNGNIWVNECYINSDIRIKEDIQDINNNSALQKILLIEPKTYKYIDKVEKGYKKDYGFVAQQIQKVLPDAVILEKSYIPNIMLIASYNNKIITLPHKPINVILKLKDKIKCIDSNDISIDVEVYKIINELTFEIKDLDKEFANNKIFVYGTYVDNFQILSKNHIFTLNVGATQELYRQIKEQEDIINSQEERMNILEEKNAILNQNFENLLKEIDLINHQLE